jgi:hypothetical protein
MKPIGHYAGFLTQEEQDEITEASLYQLYDLASDIFIELYQAEDTEFEGDPSLKVKFGKLNDRGTIALIRGLCDRIETKLMEQAS